MIRAVVFDCFGVLAGDGWLPFKDKYFGHDEALLAEATDLNKQADAGLISFADFSEAIGRMCGMTAAEVVQEIEDNPANTTLFQYIEGLKQEYKIGMLSNAPADWLHDLFNESQRSLFDASALSYETGFIKPDPRAYEVIADRLGVQLDECVFVDDQERFCTAAQELGMHAVHFKDNQQAIADISQLLK